MALTDLACKSAKPRPRLTKLSDGGGLQLWVYPNGSKLWRYAYRFGGKQKLLAIGPYPDYSLATARHALEDAKRALAGGTDPSRAKRLAKLARAAADTFETVAEEYLGKLKREGRAATTIKKTKWLLNFAYPSLGQLPIADLSAAEVLQVLKKLENRGRRESAQRLRSTIGAVIRYAIASARASHDPTPALRGALTSPMVTPRAAVTEPRALGALLRAIDGFDGQPTTRAALQLMAILFPRPGELRAAEWTDFDFEAQVWTIPAERTKMRRAHRLPLPRQAITILRQLKPITDAGKLVFPSVRSSQRPISENTMNAALRRLGYGKDQATPHGFRATASTLLNESGKWNPDAIERQLGHLEGNDIRRAYARGEHWNERVKMMAWWANYLDDLKAGGTVIDLPKKSA